MSLPESCCSSLKTSLLWGTGVETSLLSVEWAWCSQMYIICWMFDGLSMTPFLYMNHSEKADSGDNGETTVLQNRMHRTFPVRTFPCQLLYTFRLTEIKATSIQLRLRIGGWEYSSVEGTHWKSKGGNPILTLSWMHPAICSIVIPPRSLGICYSALHPVCNVGTVGLGDRPICFRIPISLFHLSF